MARMLWQDPVYRYRRAVSVAQTYRGRDLARLRSSPRDFAAWDWYYARERKRRAGLEALRLLVEAAEIIPR